MGAFISEPHLCQGLPQIYFVKDLFWELFEAEYIHLFHKLFLFAKQIKIITVGDDESSKCMFKNCT